MKHESAVGYVRGVDERIPDAVTDELFIMVRECLRNAYAHAGAQRIVARVDIAPHEVRAEIVDDGRGFEVEAVDGRGNGLPVLRERSELVGGSVDLDSSPGRDTRVSISIPVGPAPPTAPAPSVVALPGQPGDPTGPGLLSEREREVIALVAEALSNRQIANRLGITEGTVKRHLRNIFTKLRAVSRIDAVNRAVDRALIPHPRFGSPARSRTWA